MEILIAFVFFAFLGRVAIWIFKEWLSEVKSWPAYHAEYNRRLKALMSREEKTTIFQVLMPVLMAMANTVMGGVIWLLLAYISGCGLIYTMIHVLS